MTPGCDIHPCSTGREGMKQSPAELFPFLPGLGKQELMGASMGISISSSMSSHTQIHGNSHGFPHADPWKSQAQSFQSLSSRRRGVPGRRERSFLKKNPPCMGQRWILADLDALDALPLTQGPPWGTNLLSPSSEDAWSCNSRDFSAPRQRKTMPCN